MVSPRYGAEVVGGAEHWIRTLVEHMATLKGWEVEVFTTCARSAELWADEYASGTSVEGGVTVHRHRSRTIRNPEYLHMLPALRRDPAAFDEATARRYIELVGPVCPDAVDHAAGSGCDLFAVTPYLYWPAVEAAPRLGARTLLHGAAHDEPELYLGPVARAYAAVGGFCFNTYAERSLVEATFGVAHQPSEVVGHAIEESDRVPGDARAALGLGPEEPYVLSVGRVERAKGSAALASMWAAYRRRRPDAPRLVLLGPVQDRLDLPDDVVLAGRQPEKVKWSALAGCLFSVAPGALESFGLVVVESWLAGRPVLVNGRCGSTVELCRRSGGGLWFDRYGDFEVCVDRLLADAALSDGLASAGASFSRSEFSWEAVTDRYETLAGRVLERVP